MTVHLTDPIPCPVPPARGAQRTLVALVLDKSGSMGAVRETAVSGVNEVLDTLRQKATAGGDTRVSMLAFNQRVEVLFASKTPEALPTLTLENYRPGGYTALYDAVGGAISSLEREAERSPGDDVAFLVNVVTDGLENASRAWSASRLPKKIRGLRRTGDWTFTVLGANIDLEAPAEELGITRRSMVAFDATPIGTQVAMRSHSGHLGTYLSRRAAGEKGISDFYGEPTRDPTPETPDTLAAPDDGDGEEGG